MADTNVSLPGGLKFYAPNTQERAAIQAVIGKIGAGDDQSAIHSSASQAPYGGSVLDVYEFTPGASGGSYTLMSGEQVGVLEGVHDGSLTGGAGTGTASSPFLLVGNEGNDTITTGAGSTGYVFTGDGTNTVNVGSGDAATVTAGHGHNTISLAGNDTVTLGTGNDTVTAQGAATVYGGSGMETITGGPGAFTFYGSSSPTAYDSVVGGSGANFFEGGAGNDTFVGGYSTSTPGATDLFSFSNNLNGDSTAGGYHEIMNFHSGSDTISLNGYNTASVESVKHAGGGTTIQLHDGTTISVDSNVTEHVDGSGHITFT